MNYISTPISLSLIALFTLSGCVNGKQESSFEATAKEQQLEAYAKQLEQKESELYNREIELLIKQQESQQENSSTTAVSAYSEDTAAQLEPIDNTSQASAFVAPIVGDFPPNAVPGQCYAKATVAPVYETVSEQLKVKDEETLVEIIPAEGKEGMTSLGTSTCHTFFSVLSHMKMATSLTSS